MWKWIWPAIGVQPITQNTDSEMFDRADYPYTETFVREAIQNTLDARLDTKRPAVISFRFHRGPLGERKAFLEETMRFRAEANLYVPEEWARGEISWITIEDFNTKGLDGNLKDRFGNFWNYWLNFGLSNKDGSGRGGRGIGRVTLLIASRIQTVIGLTRRNIDSVTAACGMTLLRAMPTAQGPRSTHAYLAAAQDDAASVYRLHEGTVFTNGIVGAFGLSGYDSEPHRSGLALSIPYPHQELTPEGILASAVDHFAPAILSSQLTVRVDDTILDRNSLDRVAEEAAADIRSEPIRNGIERYLGLLHAGLDTEGPQLKVNAKGSGSPLSVHRDSEVVSGMQQALARGDTVNFGLAFDLTQNNRTHAVSLKVIAARAPEDAQPIDRLFREGMSLPDVKTSSPGDIDLVILVDDERLATYLNFCEGKAHLDLLQSKEVRTKLEEKGYYPLFSIRNFVKALPAEIRALLTPEITEPEIDVFDAFFAIPDTDPEAKKRRGGKPDVVPPPPPPPPPPRISPFRVRTLDDGFSIEANPDYTDWPLNLSVTMAYADGTRSPAWSEFDFRPDDLETTTENCTHSYSKNKLTARECGAGCHIQVTGFDRRREVDTRMRFWKDAQND